MYTTVTFLLFIIFVFYLWLKKTYNYWKDRGIKGPKPLPIVGNFAMVMSGKEHVEDLLKRVYDDYPNESYIGIYQAWKPTLIIKDPDMIKQILIKDFSVFQHRAMKSLYPFNDNAIMADGDLWSVLRGYMTSLLTLGKLKNYIPLLEESAEKNLNYISRLSESIQDIQYLFETFMIETNMLCLFGIDVDAHSGERDPVTDIVDDFLYPNKISRCMVYGDILFPGFQKLASILNLDPRINKIKKNFAPFLNKALVEKDRQQTDFMDRIIKMQKEKFTQKRYENKTIQIENTDTFILTQALFLYTSQVGGTGKVSSMLLYELALQQILQDRLYTEINQVYRKHNNKLTYESLNEMAYLDMTVKETYRKHFGLVIQRLVPSDYEFPGVGLKIKKGTFVMIPLLSLHMDPKYFKDPEIFDPERFSPENKKNIQDTYLPFSIGPRNCLGARVAELLIKYTVASFLMRFKVEPCEKTAKKLQYAPGLVKLKVDGGIWLKISPRSDSM